MVIHQALNYFSRSKTAAAKVEDLLQRTTADLMVTAANEAMPDRSNGMAKYRLDGINLQKE